MNTHRNNFQKKEYSLLGRFLGVGSIGKQNTISLILFILLSTGVIYSFYDSVKAKEYWTIITPFISSIIGYLIGKKNS